MNLFDVHTHSGTEQFHSIFNAEENIPTEGWFSSGVHPWNCNETKSYDFLTNILGHSRCLALGEIGLDRIQNKNWLDQLNGFETQLSINQSFKLPVILHIVRTFSETIAWKKKHNPTHPMILHGFRKNSLALELIDLGFYFSLGVDSLIHLSDEVITALPMNRIFLETDTSKESIVEMYEQLAKRKGVSFLALQAALAENFINTFTKWTPG